MPALFTKSDPVKQEIERLLKQIIEDSHKKDGIKQSYSSEAFYMADPRYFDSFVGLYFGNLTVHVGKSSSNTFLLRWRAQVPWNWPSYQSLHDKYGDYHAQSFRLPNARSMIQGQEHCLHVDDGLGGYLDTIGLAKPFLVFSEWEQTITPTVEMQK